MSTPAGGPNDLTFNEQREPVSVFRWATVTRVTGGLAIRLDGDTVALPVTPDNLCEAGSLVVNSRVWVQIFGRRMIVLGVAKP